MRTPAQRTNSSLLTLSAIGLCFFGSITPGYAQCNRLSGMTGSMVATGSASGTSPVVLHRNPITERMNAEVRAIYAQQAQRRAAGAIAVKQRAAQIGRMKALAASITDRPTRRQQRTARLRERYEEKYPIRTGAYLKKTNQIRQPLPPLQNTGSFRTAQRR